MKNILKIQYIIIFLLFYSCSSETVPSEQTSSEPIITFQDSLSYTMGVNIGQNLPETASIANYESDGRLNAPSALRNAEPIVELVREIAIKSGNALEIASGTGQHVVKLAAALPHLDWQPSDVDETRIKSIRCWSDDHHLTNLKPPCLLDATKEGWAAEHHGQDLILLVNLLHLISIEETKILVKEVSKALAPKGVLSLIHI